MNTPRTVAGGLFAAALIVIGGYLVTSGMPSQAEQEYYAKMHQFGAYSDEGAKQIAVSLCSADTVEEAKVLLAGVAQSPEVQRDPTSAGRWVAVAAVYGVEAFCPQNRGVAMQAMQELAP